MQSENPYAAPATTSPIEESVEPMPLASQGVRFGNFLLDSVFSWIASTISQFMFGFTFALTRKDPTAPLTTAEMEWLEAVATILGIAVIVLYYIVTEGLFQRTLAKFITGSKVVKATGGRPSFGQIIGRSFARLIPFEAFSFFGGQGFPVGWHDSLSGTRVVRTR